MNATTALAPGGELIGRAPIFCDVTAEAKAGLTAQERRVPRLVGNGLSNGQIAEQIHVAPSTVRSHLKHIYARPGPGSRSEAISYALRNGLT